DPAMAKAYYQRALAANALFTPATQRMAQLGPLPANGDYALRAPDASPEVKIAGTPPTEEVKLQKSSFVAHTADPGSDDLVLRPAILDVGKKKPSREGPLHVASFVPPEPSEGSTGNSGELVQLGAWRNQGDAALGWDKAAASAGDVLSGASPRIVEADVPGKGHFWRLRTQAPAGVSATEFCAKLRTKGLDCIAAKT
ncbi:MAG TPA: hypothetical protein VLC29_12025, partial [Rhizomicrobium sp.]|nr:hypothetical protein [Rhizomicrobium sp.]